MHKIENNIFISVDDELREEKIIIPEGVTEIADKAFHNPYSNREYIKEIVLPSTLKKIGEQSFGNLFIKNFSLPEGLIEIGERAFENNKGLKDLTIPKSVKVIKDYAFSGCVQLKTITFLGKPEFGDYVFNRTAISGKTIDLTVFGEMIPEGTFYQATGFDSINIPDVVKTIGCNAFAYSSVRCVDFGAVECIQDRAFAYCNNIESINFPDTIKEISAESFKSCKKLKRLQFGTGLKIIEREAFANTLSLGEVDIPKNVELIEDKVFCNSLLKKVKINGKPKFGECVFSEATQLCDLQFDLSIFGDKIPAGTFYSAKGISDIKLPECIKTIGPKAFCNSSLKSIDLSSVETIEPFAFADCIGLEEISIPDSVTKIGNNAFANTSLKEANLPSGLKTISAGVFQDCRNLTKVNIPDTVEEIGTKAFANCQLKQLVLPNILKKLGKFALQGNPLEYINLPKTIEEIGEQCFMNTPIKTILIPSKVSLIPDSCFFDCEELETVYILGDTIIDGFAFMYCSNLKKVIGHKITKIKEYAFPEENEGMQFTISEKCVIEKNGVPSNTQVIRKNL